MAVRRCCGRRSRSMRSSSSGDYARGAEIVRSVLSEPLYWIASNAGYDGQAAIDQVLASPPGHGLNALTGEFGDLFDKGVLDPVRVTRMSLEHAASVAALLLTTEAIVAEELIAQPGAIIAPGFGDLAEGMARPSTRSSQRLRLPAGARSVRPAGPAGGRRVLGQGQHRGRGLAAFSGGPGRCAGVDADRCRRTAAARRRRFARRQDEPAALWRRDRDGERGVRAHLRTRMTARGRSAGPAAARRRRSLPGCRGSGSAPTRAPRSGCPRTSAGWWV